MDTLSGVARVARNLRESLSPSTRRGKLRCTTAQAPRSSYAPFLHGDPAGNAAELRATMAEHGHLFFRGLLPAHAVLEARAEALEICRQAGWIDPNSSGLDSRWVATGPAPVDSSSEWLEFYEQWAQTDTFSSVPEHRALMSITEKLLGEPVLLHPRKIGRVGFPQNEGQQTPVHQDFFHIRGTTETFTAWVPLGDVPQRLGCLAVADGSHKLGFRDHLPSNGPGGFAVNPGDDAVWRSEDFAAGDVLIFHSLTMHMALPNRTSDEIRISLDNRYQRATDDVDPSSLRPHV